MRKGQELREKNQPTRDIEEIMDLDNDPDKKERKRIEKTRKEYKEEVISDIGLD